MVIDRQPDAIYSPPADITKIVSQLPDDIRASLSPPQVAHLVSVIRRKDHAVTYQISTNLLGIQIYLAVFAGPEDRSPERLVDERQYRSFSALLVKLGLVSLVPASLTVAGALVCLVFLYVLKSMLNIDLMEGRSFLHDYVY